MPAQTHSRVRNGFHILANSRGRLTNLNGPPCNTAAQCEKAYCCGPAIQPTSSKPRGCRRGLCSFTPNRGRKRALALGGVGSRSAATKRAISRRVENRNKMAAGYVPSATRPRNATEWPTKNATCKTPCPCCLITMTKNHPRNACLGSCARKSSSVLKSQAFTLEVELDPTQAGPPIGSPGGGGYIGANYFFGYGTITPIPTPGTGTNVLGQTAAASNSICYRYNNETLGGEFSIHARDESVSPDTHIKPFTSITLTNPNTGDSVTYNYADITDSFNGAGTQTGTNPDPYPPGPAELYWGSQVTANAPDFQFWLDAYNPAGTTTLNVVVTP